MTEQAQQPKKPVVRIRGLRVRFGDFTALDLTKSPGQEFAELERPIEIEENTITGLLGANGAGKTTLFHVLNGQIPDHEGTVEVLGESVRTAPHRIARRGVIRLFQDTRVFPTLTVRENVEAAMIFFEDRPWYWDLFQPTAATRDEHLLRVENVLRVLRLEKRADQRAGELSYGYQKLVALARVMAVADLMAIERRLALEEKTRPTLILLDEPLVGLSGPMALLVWNVIKAMASQVTIILIEHNKYGIREMCPRSLILNQGQLIADGPTDVVLDNPVVRRRFLGL